MNESFPDPFRESPQERHPAGNALKEWQNSCLFGNFRFSVSKSGPGRAQERQPVGDKCRITRKKRNFLDLAAPKPP